MLYDLLCLNEQLSSKFNNKPNLHPQKIIKFETIKIQIPLPPVLMSDEQQILPCVECNKHHEQMLMLSCLHDPCINCAAIHYVENCPKNSLFYSCSRCKEETQLDSGSVIELQRVYRTLKPSIQAKDSRKDDSKKYQYNRSLPKNSRQNAADTPYYVPQVSSYKNEKPYPSATSYTKPLPYQQPQTPISSINTSPYEIPRRPVSSQIMCVQHPEDELSYFCFSCNKPICPQCAIHGSHREHEVQTSRRAIAAIKERLNLANQNLTIEIGNLNHKKTQTKEYLAQLTETNKRDHEMIKRQYARLKGLLQQKQDEFLRSMNENYQRNCQQAKYYTDVMQKLIRSYTTVRQTIDNTFKKDDITVLNEFSKREFQAQEIIAQNSEATQESRIKNTKLVDYKLFEDEINQLSGIMETMKLTLVSTRNQY